MAPFFLGIDGGQSSTTALIADAEGVVIGRGRSGPCNHVSASEAASKFLRVIGECTAAACLQAGLDPVSVEFEAACCGMSGGPQDKKAILASLLRTRNLVVTDDGLIALCGAMAGEPGVIVVGGTGSIAYGRGQDARLVRIGGWGYVFGDEGGAFDIARQALRAILRSEEGWGSPTQLTAALLDATGAPDANHLMHLFYTTEWPRSRVATLASIVDSVADGGDSIARSILEQAAQALASLAGSVRSQLFPDGGAVRVAYIGGVFHSQMVLDRFRTLVELTGGCQCIAPLLEPASGALLEAFRAAGRSVSLVKLKV